MRRSKSDRAMTPTMEMPSRSRTSFRAALFLSESERARERESERWVSPYLSRVFVTSDEKKTLVESRCRDTTKKQIRRISNTFVLQHFDKIKGVLQTQDKK
jgi:hypothetical protein